MSLKKKISLTGTVIFAFSVLAAQNAVASKKIDDCVTAWGNAYDRERPGAIVNYQQLEEWKDWCKKGKTPKASAGNMVAVPQIDGNCENPDKVLKAAGLKPKRINVHGPVDQDAAGVGCAYRQNPKAGTGPVQNFV